MAWRRYRRDLSGLACISPRARLTTSPMLLAASTFDRDKAELLAIAFLAGTGLWAGVLMVLSGLTTPPDVEPASSGLEVGGDESPAVVGTLTNGWRFDRSAAAATLIDLTARRVLVIDQIGLDQFTVAVAPGGPSNLTPYEAKVVRLVKESGHGDPVLLAALTLPDDATGTAWFDDFERTVRNEMRSAGLSRPRWAPWMRAVMTAVAVPPALALASAVTLIPESREGNGDDGNPWALVLIIGFAVIGAFQGVMQRLQAERDTPAGVAAAGRWLGLEANLRDAGGFGDLPPTAIAVWDRYLSYATTFGLTSTILRLVPLAPESPTEAWSNESGRWRVVHIHYPRRKAMRGRIPSVLLFQGIVALLIGVAAARGYRPLVDWIERELPADQRDSLDLIRRIAWVIAVAVAVPALAWGWVATLRALLDIGRSRTTEGKVLRNRPPHLAVDDGRRDRITAFVVLVPGRGHGEGERVRVTHSPYLAYVRAIEPAAEPVEPPG